ncbi:MAG TPA: tetratricopeptide repeat protein [Ktedonobacterales bacterium]|jgi:tetratricopeptide (TPR) repeat protein|nr:tetratricopeptide repeat protein [Ktedonobacterales bacterium]
MATPQERKFAFSYVERGKQFVAAKQYPEALEALREATRRDPTLLEAWILLASVHYTLGEDIECLGATEEALKHRANSGAAWNFRGLALMRLNRDEEALDSFARTMRIEGWLVTGARNAFFCLNDSERYDEALRVVDVVLAEQQENGEFWTMRSAVLRHLHQYKWAYYAANKAMQLDPSDPYAWFQLARALRGLKRHNEALEAYKASERELEQHDVSPSSLRLRTLILREQRRFSEALAASQQSKTLEPETALNWNQVGIALLVLGRPAEAYIHFIRATALNPRKPGYASNASVALAHLRKYERALAWTDRALALRPDHPSATINRADNLVSLERYEEAEVQLGAATEITLEHSGYWAVKGSLHTRRGEYNEALVAIKRAIDLSGDDDNGAEAYERMGELLIALEDYPKALEFAEHGLELRPYDFCLQDLKAKVLHGLGREGEADEIERAVQARLAEQLALLEQAEGANG